MLFTVTVTTAEGISTSYITNATSSAAAFNAVEGDDVVRVDVEHIQCTADYWDVK